MNKRRTLAHRVVSLAAVDSDGGGLSDGDGGDSAIEEWLGEWNNPTFWKGIVVAICE